MLTAQTKKQPKYHGARKFLLLLLVLLAYGIFVSLKFGIEEGIGTTILTWSFFVLCTPIADAGFLVDFPVRLIVGAKMIISEILVWAIAILSSILYLIFSPEILDNLVVLHLFHTIITNPWPLWLIIAISAIGTFISIKVGDDIYNMVQEKRHHVHITRLQFKRLIVEITFFTVILAAYFVMLSITGLRIDAI
jgi:hypothetical protein